MTKILYFIVPGLIILSIFLLSLIPINDFDFWWHLKTGEWILENRSLPEVDPFTYTAIPDDTEAPGRPFYVLTQSWLAEIIYVLIVKNFSFKGFIIIRALVYVAIAIFVVMLSIRHSGYRFVIPAMLPFVMATPESLTDRPQMFAFLFAIMVIFLLEEVIRGKRYPLFITPLIMLINANMHGGYLVSAGYILIYMIAIPFEKRLRETGWRIILTGIPSLALTYLNPNRWNAIDVTMVLYKPEITSSVDSLEQMSPFKILPYTYNNIAWLSYWFLVIVGFVTLLYLIKERRYTWVLILAGTGMASLTSMRFIYFFLPVSTFMFAYLLQGIFGRRLKQRYAIENAIYVVTISLVILLNVRWDNILKNTYYGYFPENAVSFIKRNPIPEPIFNDIQWGGYLEWGLYPEYKMFTDTRNLIVDIFRQYMNILNWTPQGRAILDAYSIKSIITPAINPYNGEIFPLIKGLYRDDDWLLVYLDGVAMIFVKRQYYHTSIPKIYIYKQVLDEISYWNSSFPNEEGYRRSMTEAITELTKAGILNE